MIPFEPTQILQLSDRMVRVEDLPSNVRQEVGLYDEIRHRHQLAMIELEILNLALHTQHNKITTAVATLPPQEAQNEAPTADGTA